MEEFMQEIDADKEMRANINLFKKVPKTHANLAAVSGVGGLSSVSRPGNKKGVLSIGKRSGAMEQQHVDEYLEDHDGEQYCSRNNNDFEELDEEEVRLEELLDDLELGGCERVYGSATAIAAEGEEEKASIVVLTAEQAAQVPALQLGVAGPFDTASFSAKDYKFT